MTLRAELGMRRGFENLPQEALLSIYYTASQTRKKAGEFFRMHGLTDVQFNVLSMLKLQSGEGRGLTQVELSRMMLVNRANITALIDRMEKANLVVRRSDPYDRRYKVIELTDRGIKMWAKVAEVYTKKIHKLMGPLRKEELRSLVTILQKVRQNLNAPDDD